MSSVKSVLFDGHVTQYIAYIEFSFQISNNYVQMI